MALKPDSWGWAKSLWIAALILPFLIVWLYSTLSLEKLPSAVNKIDDLRKGMSRSDVAAILGTPSQISDSTWTYSTNTAWPILYIHFDNEGRYLIYEIDK